MIDIIVDTSDLPGLYGHDQASRATHECAIDMGSRQLVLLHKSFFSGKASNIFEVNLAEGTEKGPEAIGIFLHRQSYIIKIMPNLGILVEDFTECRNVFIYQSLTQFFRDFEMLIEDVPIYLNSHDISFTRIGVRYFPS